MNSHKHLVRSALLFSSFFVSACGDDDNPAPSGPIIIPTDPGLLDGGAGPLDAGGSLLDATLDGTTASDGASSEPAPTDPGLEAPPPRAECAVEPNGTANGTPCWDLSACNGTASVQFLRQCSDTCVAPFNNSTRIQGFSGTLPPLN